MVLHSDSKQSNALSLYLKNMENLAWKQFSGRGLERGGSEERVRLIKVDIELRSPAAA